jgi:hypothetical protein
VGVLIISLLALFLLAAPTLAAPATNAPPAAAPSPAPVRLAVLAADSSAGTAALADLLTVQLAQTPGVETVERAELDRVLREQALTAAGLADGVQGRVAVGRLLRADGFLFLARTASQRQFASRLVEARHGCQVMQMLYATNEAPTAIAERLAGAVSAKLPTLRLADEQRILLNVIRLGNATLDSRAGWIETDGVTMLSGYLAAHPAVLVVERREMGMLLKESQLADAGAPAFRAADFLIDGDVFLTPGAAREGAALPVTLVLRLRDMQLAEQARVTRHGDLDVLEDLLAEAAAGMLMEAAMRRPAVEGAAQLESRFMRDFGHFGLHRLWAVEAAYALDATNAAARRALVSRLLRVAQTDNTPALATWEQCRGAYMERAHYLAQAVSLIQQDPDLKKERFITRSPMAHVLNCRNLKQTRQYLDWANDRELQEMLQPVRARARIEMEQHLLPHVGWYPSLCQNIHMMFENQAESATYLQALAERLTADPRLKPLERHKRVSVLLSCTTLPPRLYDNLCTNADPVVRFFAHVKAARVSASAEKRGQHYAAVLELLPDVLRCTQLAIFFAEWHSRNDGHQHYNFLRNTLLAIRNAGFGKQVNAALLAQCEAWLEAGDLASLCDTWSDQYFEWFEQGVANSLLDRIGMLRTVPSTRLPRSSHGKRALERIGKSSIELARRRSPVTRVAPGDKLAMLAPNDRYLREHGISLDGLDFAVTPQRLLVDGDKLWIALGGHDLNDFSRDNTDYTGLIRMDLKTGAIDFSRFGKIVTPRGRPYVSDCQHVYHAFSPLFFWKANICLARRGQGVYLFPRDAPAGAGDLSDVRLLGAEIGLSSLNITGAAALGDTLYIALPNTLLAWRKDAAQARVVAVTATETATGPLASVGLIDGLVADAASGRLYLFTERSIWRYTPADDTWTKLVSDDRRVSTSRLAHGIITSTPGLVLFTKTRSKGRGRGSLLNEALVDITACFRMADESIGDPPVELATPANYLARYDLARYRGGTIVIGGNYFTPGTPPDWELAYLVGATNTISSDMAWLVPPPAPKPSPAVTSEKPADSSVFTPLVAAALADDRDGLNRLLDAGALVDEYDMDDMTPLAHAAANGKAAAVRTLIARGADIDVPNAKGWTPLMLAAERGQLRCVELLLAAGADPRHRDNQSRTALQVSPDPGIVRALMEAGANPLEPDISGHYPMDFCSSGSEKCEMLWLGTMPGALEVNRRPLPVRPPLHLVHTARVDRALARLRQGETLSDAEHNACLIAFARYHTEVSSRQKYMYARRFTEPERTEYYLQAVKMSFIDWRRHGGWAFRSDVREAVCPGIEQRLADGPFDPYLAFCTLFRKVQRGETDAARRDFERIRASDPFLARYAIQWSYRYHKQTDWLIEPYLASGDSDKVRQLAHLVRQQETPEMLHIAADLYRRCGDNAESKAMLERAEKMEKQ